MKILQYILFIIIFFIGCSNSTDKISIKGNGIIVNENRMLENFHSIDARGAFNVVVKQSNNYTVKVKTDENIIEHISTDIIDQVLFIKYKQKGTYSESKQTTIFIEMPILNYIGSGGANNFDINKVVNENLLEINGNGAGNININGNAQNVSIDIAGSINVKAKKLISKNMTINASGACIAELHAIEFLDINLSGACSVYYVGTPITLNKETSGMCTIKSILE